jgi:hypothetical protein
MTSPNAGGEPEGERRARYPGRGRAGGQEGGPSPSQNVHPESYDDAETALGGADSVEKTSYVTGRGTEPEGAPRAGSPIARTPSGSGINVGAWIVALIAVAIALVYGFGIFR